MKDSEKIGERFVAKQYISDEAQVVIDRLKADKKERKLARKKLKISNKKELAVA